MHKSLLCLALFPLVGCDVDDFGSSERFQSDFHYSYKLSPGKRISVENFNGAVEITGWEQDSVEISGTKYARTEQLRDSIKIEVIPSETSIAIRTVRPFERNGNMGARYTIHVPRKTELERISSSNGAIRVSDVDGMAHLRSSNGSIRMTHVQGSVEAQTSNGAIEIEDSAGTANLRTTNGHVRVESVKGPIEAITTNGSIKIRETSGTGSAPLRLSTSNGPIEVRMDTPVKADLRASTSNGSITVHMPEQSSARVRASTTHDKIVSDFEVAMQGRLDQHHLDGNINGANSSSPLLDLSTSNGHIRILRM